MIERYKILIDTDPGYDDALAILFAGANSDKFDIIGITTVFGNSSLKNVNLNLVGLLNYFDLKIPYAFGSKSPLNGINAETDISKADLFNLSFSIGMPEALIAEDFLMKMIDESLEPIIIAAMGPLTNIAKLILKYPETIVNIDKIVIMGGALNMGNVTPVAEFNIFCDPEAAEIVFKAGIPIVMAGLEVTRLTALREKDLIEIENIGCKQKRLVELILKCSSKYGLNPKRGIPIHDVCTIMYLSNPEIFKTQKYNIGIETKGELTRGMTVVDRRLFSKQDKNVEMLTDINEDKFKELLIYSLKNI